MHKIDVSSSVTIVGDAIKSDPMSHYSHHKRYQRIDIKNLELVCFIESGSFSFFRARDDVLTLSCRIPSVIGIAQMLYPSQTHYIRCETDCHMWVIRIEDAIQLFTRQNLWGDAFRILAGLTQQYFERDYMIAQKNSREIVLQHLRFIWDLPIAERENISVYSFILQRNYLSRSVVHKLTAELSEQGILTMHRGKLIAFSGECIA